MITVAELTAMRAAMTCSFEQTCTIRRPSDVVDSTGGTTRTWADAITVACRIAGEDAVGRSEEDRHGRVEATTRWTVTLPHNTDVRVADRIVTAGRTLEVVRVDDLTALRVSTRVQCTEVR